MVTTDIFKKTIVTISFYQAAVNKFYLKCKTIFPICNITYDFLVSLRHVVTYVLGVYAFYIFAVINFLRPYSETVTHNFTTLCKAVPNINALLPYFTPY